MNLSASAPHLSETPDMTVAPGAGAIKIQLPKVRIPRSGKQAYTMSMVGEDKKKSKPLSFRS
jgi:hypothetical protein